MVGATPIDVEATLTRAGAADDGGAGWAAAGAGARVAYIGLRVSHA